MTTRVAKLTSRQPGWVGSLRGTEAAPIRWTFLAALSYSRLRLSAPINLAFNSELDQSRRLLLCKRTVVNPALTIALKVVTTSFPNRAATSLCYPEKSRGQGERSCSALSGSLSSLLVRTLDPPSRGCSLLTPLI